MNKPLPYIIIVIVAVGAFFGGYKYAQSKVKVTPLTRATGAGAFRGARGGGAQGNNNFTGGQIVSKDDKSLTVQQMGSTKIVFYSPSTQVNKTVSGSPSDLAQGQQVTITGTPNPDGSLNAQSIQIRPNASSTQPSGR